MTTKKEQSEQIKKQTEEYLAKGGTIDTGEVANMDKYFLSEHMKGLISKAIKQGKTTKEIAYKLKVNTNVIGRIRGSMATAALKKGNKSK